MGTNYYEQGKEPCTCCGRPYEPLHIGKSSVGWCFSLHVTDEIPDLKAWLDRWNSETVILDEYGKRVPMEEMILEITGRRREPRWDKNPIGYDNWEDFHKQNQSEQGPNGLLRHVVDGFHCVSHGAGTWDCIRGDFS